MKKPFIYIAALRRTGSTMLCEALTEIPYSLVLNEPNFNLQRAIIRGRERALLLKHGVDTSAFTARWAGWRRRFVMQGFRWDLSRRLGKVVQQLGVKEIFHDNWQAYHKAFPNLRVIVTGRDPRDIYISLYNRWTQGRALWSGDFTPERVAKDIEYQFRKQLEIVGASVCMKIRYEDLCSNPNKLEEIKTFVESPIPGVGDIGGLLRADSARHAEYSIHGNSITDRRIFRWRDEQNPKLLDEAQKVFDLTKEYCEFWAYLK